MGIGDDADRCVTAALAKRVDLRLNFLHRAPLVLLTNDRPVDGGSEVCVDELLPAPGIHRIDGSQPDARAHNRVRESAIGGDRHGGSATAVTLPGDTGRVEILAFVEDSERSEHIERRRCKAVMGLFGDR